MAAWVAFKSIKYSSANRFCFFVTQTHLPFRFVFLGMQKETATAASSNSKSF
nr:MAG TPA: hypothetical protein [Caudoviricetes sp.]